MISEVIQMILCPHLSDLEDELDDFKHEPKGL